MFKLVIADDEGKTTVVPLVRDEITIGRREGNTIRLTERNISRKHAKLRKVDGSYVVEDLSSYNGVKVNGRRIGGEIAIKAGDQIAIGDYQLALQVEGAAADGSALPGGGLAGDGATLTDTTAPTAMPGAQYASGAEPSTAMIQAPGAATIPMSPGMASGAPANRPPARLVMTSPPAPGAEFALSRPVTRLGRAEELDVWVNHRSISREHAEITNDGGTIRIRDLGSANGVRVNGRDTSQAELKPGDVVELGQVRFRFVAPGESFVFEADRTMQLDAISAPEKSGSRAPLLVAAGIVGLAVIGAVAVALSGGTDPQSATELPSDPGVAVTTASDPQPVVPAAAVPDGALLDQQVAVAVGACRTAITSGDYATAISRADQALTLRADDPQAAACRADAEQARLESDAFARGEALRRAGDVEGAFVAFAELPDGSTYRGRPEVLDTNHEFALLQIARANELLATSPDEALSHAQNALLVPGLDPRIRAQADAIVRRARVRGGTAVTARDRTPRVRTDVRPTPIPHPTPTSTGGSQATTTTGGGTTTAAGGGDGGSPLAAAQACLARGDNPCVIRALEGRARTPQEMRLLIETYRAMGNSPRMLDTMGRFVQRYPSDPRAGQYRQILAQQGR